MMTLTDYLGLYSSCVLTTSPAKVKELDYVARVAATNKSTYFAVQAACNIPWPLVAAIHFREANQNFTRHLHNGDPLTARTVHVPVGRPLAGQPPFSWQNSASDALSGVWRPLAWDIANCLEFIERYNGLGYQKHGINSPYLWDYTSKYTSGLFVSDGSFDPNASEARPGAVAILKTLESMGVSLEFSSMAATKPVFH